MAGAIAAGSGGDVGGDVGAPAARPLRVFCDADVLISGAASTVGASHILLRLSELTLVDCFTSRYVLSEVERNLSAKLLGALAAFQLIVHAAFDVVPDGSAAARVRSSARRT